MITFSLSSTEGSEVSDQTLLGNPYVLYFYPKDDTPGCTTEACGFRDLLPKFAPMQAKVYGVSPDSIKKHHKFIAKHELNFPLLADPDKELIGACGLWIQKKFMGREYMGVQRASILVDAKGKIAALWPTVSPADHPAEVLAAIEAL
jgi:peroxiredoxin Q/BCP